MSGEKLARIPLPPHIAEIVEHATGRDLDNADLRDQRIIDQIEDDRTSRERTAEVIICANEVIEAWLHMQLVIDRISLSDPLRAPEQWRLLTVAMLGIGTKCLRLQRALQINAL